MKPYKAKMEAIKSLAENLNPMPIREVIKSLESIAARKEREYAAENENAWAIADSDGDMEYFKTKQQAIDALAKYAEETDKAMLDAGLSPSVLYLDEERMVDSCLMYWIEYVKPKGQGRGD